MNAPPVRSFKALATHACVIALALACAGCVTEVQKSHKSRGVSMDPKKSARASASSTAADKASPVAPIAKPEGPIAKPILSGVTSSHVQTTVTPLGMISYDAQTLPIVSPDGRYVAVQQGQAPTWDTLLATRGQEPADQSRVGLYLVTDRGLNTMTSTDPMSFGLILGRDADAEGFLVESVRSDRARWVGRVAWASGKVEWLVKGPGIAAQASIVQGEGSASQSGGLVFVRRDVIAETNDLVFRDASGRESVLHDAIGSFLFPTPSSDGSVIFACLVQPSGSDKEPGTGTVDLVAVRTVDDGEHAGARKLGAIVAQRPLGSFSDPFAAAYQVFASVQPGAWCHAGSGAFRGAMGFAHPGRGRAAVMFPGEGVIRWMPERTVGVVGWNDARQDGYFCTAPKELVYQMQGSGDTQPSPVRVLNSPYVARVVKGAASTQLLLFGPSNQRQDQMEVIGLGVGAPPGDLGIDPK